MQEKSPPGVLKFRRFDPMRQDIEAFRCVKPGIMGENEAAKNLRMIDSSQVDGSALPGCDALHRLAMDLQAADAHLLIAGMDTDRFARPQRAAPEGAGDNRAKAFHRETSIDGEARQTVRIARGNALGERCKFSFQRGEICASGCADRNDGSAVEKGTCAERLDLATRFFDLFGAREIGLG